MSEIRDNAVRFEAVKSSFVQTKDGWKMTLVIHPNDMPEALSADWIGTRYMVAMVKLDDQEQPVDRNKEQHQKVVQQAAILCRDPQFQLYVITLGLTSTLGEEAAAKALCADLLITSRAELATNDDARAKFLLLVGNFRLWQASRNTR